MGWTTAETIGEWELPARRRQGLCVGGAVGFLPQTSARGYRAPTLPSSVRV
ncbi:MAG: hypothetical protein MR522_08495 [Trueperella sp.]|uniref:hypothetical protein n=1 Tax=Trueperella sp. TaxID=2699835 RepID=UPI0025F4E40C|nr:hypothetical protein [Trueperella sp.]MCI7306283.1 hypothetical protein [Trueperella sp.]MDY5403155.1 hypothetical protein [Trueperella sp.]